MDFWTHPLVVVIVTSLFNGTLIAALLAYRNGKIKADREDKVAAQDANQREQNFAMEQVKEAFEHYKRMAREMEKTMEKRYRNTEDRLDTVEKELNATLIENMRLREQLGRSICDPES